MSRGERVTLILRVTMEIGVVAALGAWGYSVGGSTGTRIGLMIAAPLVGFGFWGAVDFRRAGRFAEPLRLTQELVVTGLAAVASYAAGHHAAAVALAALSVVYHALVYATGERLLKAKARSEGRQPQAGRRAQARLNRSPR